MANGEHGDEDNELPSAVPGTVINGKYRIDGLIGRGGMGSVWSAMHLGLNQRVAIKLIARRFANSREARQRFDVEARSVAQLRSRYVVQVYDNGETQDGTPYLVMEMLEGESLDARIQKQGTVPLDETLRFISHVARALTRAHSLGIVHRDLKPDNIFITRGDEDDDSEIAKVLDFGIAKIKSASSSGSATRTGAVLGTPLFMSPEQARALKTVDHRTDIYSLGMVTFMMLTGQPAFSGESFGDILVAICTQPLPEIRALAPWLPPGISGWLARACAREPDARFASIDEMIDGLYAAAGVTRPNLRKKEIGASESADFDPHGKTAISGGVRPGESQPGSTPVAVPTMTAVAVTGAGLPSRSLVLPMVLAAAALLIIGGALTFVLANHATAPQRAERPAAAAPSLGVAIPPTPPEIPAPHAGQDEPAKPLPTGAPAGASSTPASPTAPTVSPPAQKSAGAVKPSGKVVAPSDVKPAPKSFDVKPSTSKSAPSPDLGF